MTGIPRWTADKEVALQLAVGYHGEGKWSKILSRRMHDLEYDEDLVSPAPCVLLQKSGWTNVNLKDKWRNLQLRKRNARMALRAARFLLPHWRPQSAGNPLPLTILTGSCFLCRKSVIWKRPTSKRQDSAPQGISCVNDCMHTHNKDWEYF